MMVERDEPRRMASHQPIAEELHLNHDDGTHYRYKNPRTNEERMAILEIQLGPDKDGMCNVRNNTDGEIYDVEYDKLAPIR